MPWNPLTDLSIRIVDEIQRNVIKRGKRNAVSRWLRAEDDGRAVATWRSELNSIQDIFNVRAIDYPWPLLTV